MLPEIYRLVVEALVADKAVVEALVNQPWVTVKADEEPLVKVRLEVAVLKVKAEDVAKVLETPPNGM